MDRRTVLQSAGGAAVASVLAGALSEAMAASDADGTHGDGLRPPSPCRLVGEVPLDDALAGSGRKRL